MASFTPLFTQENIDTLVAAIATGATQVQYGDKMVSYRSLTEMRELLGLMCDDVAQETTNTVTFGRRTVGNYKSNK